MTIGTNGVDALRTFERAPLVALGGGSAAGLGALLLATLGADTIGRIVRVLDPVAYAVSLFVIIGACRIAASIPAARAARLDPTRALRQE